MLAQTNIKTYYLSFINKAKEDKYKANKLLKELQTHKEEVIHILEEKKEYIKDKFHIDFDNYTEWTEKVHNPKKPFYLAFYYRLNECKDVYEKNILYQGIKYSNILNREDILKKAVDFANKKIALTPTQYENYIRIYYNQVHKEVLEGGGYEFIGGLGTFIINHWKNPNGATRQILDYAATNARKKELLKQGVKLYDDKEAAWYAARHIKYDAVDYRVFRSDSHYYEITFINPKIVHSSSSYDYKHTEYINKKLRGLSYAQIVDKYCKNLDDIVNMRLDIKYKLNMFLYLYPAKYINFVRNADQNKYKHRKNYCKD